MSKIKFSDVGTDMYLGADNQPHFCVSESERTVSMYHQGGGCSWIPVGHFKTSGFTKFGLDIEHECHYLRNGIIQATGRYFLLMYTCLERHMMFDSIISPVEDLVDTNKVEYSIVSHEWGTVIKEINYYNHDNNFVRYDCLKYNYRAEKELREAKLGLKADKDKLVADKALIKATSINRLNLPIAITPLLTFEQDLLKKVADDVQ